MSVESKKINSDYAIKENMFTISNNYRFIGWNTLSDGSGTNYNSNDTITLTSNIKLYAIWKSNSLYGDINLDGKVDIVDSDLLDKYIKENNLLDGILLSNSDVNLDGKIDVVDVDIIKQASLGTKGYTGLLSNAPVSIYEVYKGNVDNNNNGGGSSSNTGNSNKPSDKPSNTPSNNNNTPSNNNGTSNENIINDNKNEDLSSEDILVQDKDEVILNKDEDLETGKKKSYAWILILGILIISLRFIILIIKKIIKIKKNSDNNSTE